MAVTGNNILASNHHLQIGAAPYYPWVTFEVDDEGKGKVLKGVLIHLLEIMSQHSNFTFSVKTTSSFGNRLNNGTWTGLIGMLMRREIHLAVPWVQTRPDNPLMEASQVCSYTNSKILSSIGTQDDFSLDAFLKAFDIEIWYFTLGLVVATVAVSAASDVLISIGNISRRVFLKYAHSYCWMFCSALFCEGTPKTPVSRRSQFLMALWLLSILTMMNAFSGQFKASLTVQAEQGRVDSMQDLMDKDHLVPYLIKDDFTVNYLRTVKIESYQAVLRNSERLKGLVPVSEFYSSSLQQKVKDGLAVLITEQNAIKNILRKDCQTLLGIRRFHLSRDNVQNFFGCMVFGAPMRAKFGLKTKLNQLITRLVESHVFRKMLEETTKGFWKCEIGGDIQESSLKLKHLLPMFYFLVILHFISFVIFTVELLFFFTGFYKP